MVRFRLGTQQIYRLYLNLWNVLDWLYPPSCGGCDAQTSRWCHTCQDNTHTISPPICHTCGLPFSGNSLCDSCRSIPPKFEFARSWALYEGPIRNAIHRLKYRRDIAMGERLSRPLIEILISSLWHIDIVIPIPLGRSRWLERGYNQVDFIARPIAIYLNLPYKPHAVRRQLETASQVGLDVLQRRKNVRGAFRAKESMVSGRSVLLVDDVITTGATMDSCAAVLLDAGAKRVYALSIGRTVLNS